MGILQIAKVVVALVVLLQTSGVRVSATDAPSTPTQEREKWLERSPLRAAPPPPEAVLHGGGGGSGPDYDEWNQRIDTTLSPYAVLQHYVATFIEQGWTFGAIVPDGSVAFVMGNSREDAAVSRHALLFAARSATEPGSVQLMLRLTARADEGK